MKAPARALLAAAAAAIALTAIAASAFWWRLPGRLPTDDDYRAVNALIAAELQPGDAVSLQPPWADRGRDFLTAAPAFAGDGLSAGAFSGARRLWLVALADAPRFDLQAARRAMQARGAATRAGERLGGLWVESFDLGPSASVFSFTDEIAKASVSLGGAQNTPCPLRADGLHQCAHGPWNNVHAAWFEVDEQPLRCLWAHPVGADPLQIRFENVPLGSEVRGRAAFIGQAARSGAPVNLAVTVDGREQALLTFPSQVEPQPFAVRLPAGSRLGDVTFAVTTAHAGMRHFCFDAWVVR